VAHGRVTCAARQEGQAALQPSQQRVGRQHPHPCSGQLDGQWQPIQPPADFSHGGGIDWCQHESRRDSARPLDEQLHRRRGRDGLQGLGRVRYGERRDRHAVFGPQP
jgi:hypothetical protein